MKKYVKPIVRMIELETMDLLAGSTDETGVGDGYHHQAKSSSDEWEE